MKLSIITINRNNAEGLRKTIESVVAQTFTDFEYIVIDGASTDESVKVIKQYEDKITYWVSEPDNGIYNAMNKGIVKAHGEYLQFLNSGDYYADKNVVKNVQSYLDKDIVYGGIICVDKNMEKVRLSLYNKQEPSLLDFYDSFFLHPSSFIRRGLFDVVGPYDENLSIVADWKWFLQAIVIKNVQIKYFDVDVVCFDMNGVSSVSSLIEIQERSKVLHDLIPHRILVDYQKWSTTIRLIQDIQKRRILNFFYKVLIWFSKKIMR